MISGVQIWWVSISSIAVLNIGLWILSARLFNRRRSNLPIQLSNYAGRRWILGLSAVYTLGCAFRSVVPRVDLERLCLVDSWVSSILVGRSVATIAELCFIAQCAILLHEAGKGQQDRLAVNVAVLLVPIVVIAEFCSWYAALSTNYLGSVIEESLWMISGCLLIASFATLWRRAGGRQRRFLEVVIMFAVGYVIFMATVDVPMHVTRWQADILTGQAYLTLGAGLKDAAQNCLVAFDWRSWREEIPWMTLYFTAAVWLSIALAHAPGFRSNEVLISK